MREINLIVPQHSLLRMRLDLERLVGAENVQAADDLAFELASARYFCHSQNFWRSFYNECFLLYKSEFEISGGNHYGN